jgi:hypothetical protein
MTAAISARLLSGSVWAAPTEFQIGFGMIYLANPAQRGGPWLIKTRLAMRPWLNYMTWPSRAFSRGDLVRCLGFALVSAVCLFVLLAAGCAVGRDTGQVYDVDWGKLGTGESVFSPLTDEQYVDGMPMDARTKK